MGVSPQQLLQQAVDELNKFSAEPLLTPTPKAPKVPTTQTSVPLNMPANMPSISVANLKNSGMPVMPLVKAANSSVDTVRVANALKAYQAARTEKNPVNGYNASSAGHKKTNPNSGHDKGTAFDWMVKAPNNQTAIATIERYAPQGLRYLIHNNLIYEAKNNWKPVPYGGTFKNGAKKDAHTGHMHLEF